MQPLNEDKGIPLTESRNYDFVKHLELISTAISRMSQNSFMCKGWAAAILTAFVALENTRDILSKHPVLPVFLLIVLYFLDSYYLAQERLYVKLYDNVRTKNYINDPYTMSNKIPLNGECEKRLILRAMFSFSEWPIYVIPMLVLLYLSLGGIE